MFDIIHVADSFADIKTLDTKAVTHVITDPPYDAHCQANQCSGSLVGKKSVPKIALPFEALTGAGCEAYAFTRDLLRVAERWCLVFSTLEAFGFVQALHGEYYRRGAVWYKPNSMGQLTGDRPAVAFEGINCLHGPKPRWNAHGAFGFYVCNGTRGEPGRHPNQKPLKLLCELILRHTDPDELIFDPFAGSGRIGEAALLCGRHYLGWERDEAWCEVASKRLSRAESRFGILKDRALQQCVFKKGELVI